MYPPEYFYRQKRFTARSRGKKTFYASICNGCRDVLDDDRLLRQSLAGRIRHHAKQYGIPLIDMRVKYGLTNQAVLEWFKRTWSTGVLACGCPTHAMHHGWRDAEIDRIDPDAEPYFPHNWQIMCSVHNNSKSRSSPAEFNARMRGNHLWHERRGLLA